MYNLLHEKISSMYIENPLYSIYNLHMKKKTFIPYNNTYTIIIDDINEKL